MRSGQGMYKIAIQHYLYANESKNISPIENELTIQKLNLIQSE